MARLRSLARHLRQPLLWHRAPPPPAVPDPVPGDTRPVSFAPLGQVRPLFFLHIPKTSGSSINRMLAGFYGETGMLTHAEYPLPHLMNGSQPTLRLDCVSGHIPLCRWDLMRGTQAYARATILRDPWARLVSHINWTNRFNHGKDLPPDSKTLPTLQKVVAQLAVTDFRDRASLQALFDTVDAETEFMPFDNMQVRMLVTGHPRANFRKPGPAELDNAVANYLACAVRGVCEDQPRFRRDLAAWLGHPPGPEIEVRENPGQKLGLTTDNRLAREVLAPWIALDEALYARALAEIGA
jgi:hypothetical protein